jgi:hypothetical protein
MVFYIGANFAFCSLCLAINIPNIPRLAAKLQEILHIANKI